MAIAFEDSRRALEQQLSTKLDLVHLVLLLFLVILVIWAVTGEIDVYRTSQSGTLTNEDGAMRVQTEVAATVKHTELSLGMRVTKGQLLVQFDDTSAKLTLFKLQDELQANRQQHNILIEQVHLTEQKYQLQEDSLQREIKQIAAQLAQAEKVLKTQHSIEQGYNALAKSSAVSNVDLLRQNLEVVQAESTMVVKSIELDNKKEDIPRNQRELELAVSQINSQISALNDQKEQLNRAITRAKLEVEKYALRAVDDGEVVQLIALPTGNHVNSGEILATISGSRDWLIHSSFKASDAVGHVKQGQMARVLVDGFPWRQYGSLEGSVSHVAKEGYQGQVDIFLKLKDNPGSEIPLTFGQPVTVEIKTQTLSPMMLLLNAADRAVRHQSPGQL